MTDKRPGRRRSMSPEQRKAAADRRSRRGAIRAYEIAAEMGPFTPVEPASRLAVDVFPQLGPGQVYAFEAGLTFHPGPCSVVMHLWDSKPESVKVLAATTVGARRLCSTCAQTAV